MYYRKLIKEKLRASKTPDLTQTQKKSITQYFNSHGYKNINLSWHRFFTAFNNEFSVKYMPDDIFHPLIASRLNQSKQWPALLDKNLLETLFKEFKQPQSVVKNINGTYYINNRPVSIETVVDVLSRTSEKLVIKPSIESGAGKDVFGFYVKDTVTTHNDLSVIEMLKLFKKDFIIQKVLRQNKQLKTLNSSSLNTLRIMSYLKNNQVHFMSTICRIGKSGQFTDNVSGGGMAGGVDENGYLRKYAYFANGNKTLKTDSGIALERFKVPSYDLALKMVKELHHKVPYFKIVSWDIAIGEDNEPVLIEYNTYRQDIRIHQLANGPVFETFIDELLKIGKS